MNKRVFSSNREDVTRAYSNNNNNNNKANHLKLVSFDAVAVVVVAAVETWTTRNYYYYCSGLMRSLDKSSGNCLTSIAGSDYGYC